MDVEEKTEQAIKQIDETEKWTEKSILESQKNKQLVLENEELQALLAAAHEAGQKLKQEVSEETGVQCFSQGCLLQFYFCSHIL